MDADQFLSLPDPQIRPGGTVTMARDAGLEALIRDELQSVPGVSEKAMFGGWAWLLDRHLLCGARHDGMLVRLGKGNDAWALELEDVASMLSGERVMSGWVRCGPITFGNDARRKQLLASAMAFVSTLPAK